MRSHLGDGEAGGEKLHTTGVLGDGEIPLFEVAVLAVQHHIARRMVHQEVIADAVPEIVGGGSADDVVDEVVRKGGVDPQNEVGVKLALEGSGVGRGGWPRIWATP